MWVLVQQHLHLVFFVQVHLGHTLGLHHKYHLLDHHFLYGENLTKFCKTVAVVSLFTSNKTLISKDSTQLDYKVVTQVVVTLEAGHCSPVNVAELVCQQVGFEVILLDSKCFPVLESETTSGIDF